MFLKTIQEEEIFPAKKPDKEVLFEDRRTGKAVVIDRDGNVGLVGNRTSGIFLLPGGGVDDDESIEEGVLRECVEEIGCRVSLKEKVGVIDDYRARDGKHCITHCYLADVVGEKGEPQLIEEEQKNGLYTAWVSIDEAIKIFDAEEREVREGKVKFYNTCFNVVRDRFFLHEAKTLLDS